MSLTILLFTVVAAYLLGSIPSSVWYGIGYFGIDVRKHGSGNAGATNTFRVLGKRAGTVVMLIDVLKGWTATSLASMLFYLNEIGETELLMYKIIFGIIAIIGHIFPVFVKFKGGKGIATLLGMVLAIHPELASLCITIFILTLLTSQYVSLSSILATLAFPVLSWLGVFGHPEPLLVVFGFTMFVLVVFTHQKNIIRLVNGNENRVNLFARSKQASNQR
ncbi:glycerol-3-phosphate 1-O-acyltransferase PlsY [Dyadobacter sandarakinus]|uniref:Glycerol-3-phosphate acyltransferase n=1 Tax=Dyadobacter sandarakinus TaxID=2747268 RepID=A0ABX7IBT4_9BACT|nr:glycerol-3-phosphate 1-O-acyltransferase PlsY [Dyadobacter sandarakinus]QRR02922.1 glycerol-3-phosphate 1-O-acyltransferase PlsY [Dyadobacter sandarakinus]